MRTSVVTIGRAEDSNIVMPVHQVSRRHALIKFDGEGFVVIDQRSTNGTYVNGESVQRRRLEAGDVIGVGPFELVFSRGAPRPPAERDDSTVVVAIPGAFSGELSEVSVPEICQLIELNQKTGVLVFHQGTQRGKVHFKAGRAVHAEFRDLLGDDAATELLSLTKGSFRFLATTSVHVQTTIKKPTALLLLEAAQRADEQGL
jgi:pSer/pThr/pTyr-binding forkhead associated (FHA) protein